MDDVEEERAAPAGREVLKEIAWKAACASPDESCKVHILFMRHRLHTVSE